jgi:hypothetical protein
VSLECKSLGSVAPAYEIEEAGAFPCQLEPFLLLETMIKRKKKP